MITEEITTPTSEATSPATASGKNPYAFNWETAGKSGDIYSAEERKNMEQLYDRTLSSVVEHDIVEGLSLIHI